jgi:protein-S-isoprenylcysteine O-methyltransferase Ste14
VNLLAVVGSAVCWSAVVLVWLLGAIYNQSHAPAEQTRVPFRASMIITVLVVAVVSRAVPRTDWQPVTVSALWVRLPGLGVLLVSTAFTLWARLRLGTMWSASPVVKEEHALRTSGPYRITRHPIYTGLLGMLAGTTLLAGIGHWVLLVPVYLVLIEVKIRLEENLMLAAFPDDYPRYRQQVPQLVPGLRLPWRRAAG